MAGKTVRTTVVWPVELLEAVEFAVASWEAFQVGEQSQ